MKMFSTAVTLRRMHMTARLKSQRGMSLVEATIILMTLALLTAVIAPSAADYIEDSRNTKAKEDVEALGLAIARLVRDTGLPCVSLTGTSCTIANKAELLVSGTVENTNEPVVDTSALATGATISSAANVNWAGGTDEVADASRDLMTSHLVTNSVSYTAPSFGTGGLKAGVGWRGAYIGGPVGLDPWGKMYQASTLFVGVATNAGAGTGTGQLSGGWNNDVVVVSAGPNGIIQTAFGGTGSSASGDDVAYVIQGSTR